MTNSCWIVVVVRELTSQYNRIILISNSKRAEVVRCVVSKKILIFQEFSKNNSHPAWLLNCLKVIEYNWWDVEIQTWSDKISENVSNNSDNNRQNHNQVLLDILNSRNAPFLVGFLDWIKLISGIIGNCKKLFSFRQWFRKISNYRMFVLVKGLSGVIFTIRKGTYTLLRTRFL